MLTYADVSCRMLPYADVCRRMLAYADVCCVTGALNGSTACKTYGKEYVVTQNCVPNYAEGWGRPNIAEILPRAGAAEKQKKLNKIAKLAEGWGRANNCQRFCLEQALLTCMLTCAGVC
jgi:hypothetical protein